MTILGTVLRWAAQWRARGQTVETMRRRMATTGANCAETIRSGSPSARSLEQARHVTGMERWAQARLRVLVGGPALNDEYDAYRPDELTTMPALADAFAATRADTLALVDEIKAAGLADKTVPHNELGALTVPQWLVYLDDHANRELMLVR